EHSVYRIVSGPTVDRVVAADDRRGSHQMVGNRDVQEDLFSAFELVAVDRPELPDTDIVNAGNCRGVAKGRIERPDRAEVVAVVVVGRKNVSCAVENVDDRVGAAPPRAIGEIDVEPDGFVGADCDGKVAMF